LKHNNNRFKIFKRIIPALLRRVGLSQYFNFLFKTKFDEVLVNIPTIGGIGEELLREEKNWKYDLLKILFKEKKEYIFVDVGANIGQTFLQLLLALGSNKNKLQYYAFEPNIDCYFILKKFVFSNVKNAVLFPWALSARNDYEKIYLIDKYDSGGAIIPEIRSRNECNYEFISTYKLDSNNELKLFPGFILKIDVEGYENEVIEGASKIIKTYRPIILCEVLHADSKDLIKRNTIRKKELTELFHKNNYQIWQILKSNNSNEDKLLGIELISDFPTGLCWWDSPSSIDFLITPIEQENHIYKLQKYLKKSSLQNLKYKP
tara:strand:+ start:281 stop:1237 length:957 start_codon:yes stop_codon:yes gene_type:complete